MTELSGVNPWSKRSSEETDFFVLESFQMSLCRGPTLRRREPVLHAEAGKCWPGQASRAVGMGILSPFCDVISVRVRYREHLQSLHWILPERASLWLIQNHHILQRHWPQYHHSHLGGRARVQADMENGVDHDHRRTDLLYNRDTSPVGFGIFRRPPTRHGRSNFGKPLYCARQSWPMKEQPDITADREIGHTRTPDLMELSRMRRTCTFVQLLNHGRQRTKRGHVDAEIPASQKLPGDCEGDIALA